VFQTKIGVKRQGARARIGVTHKSSLDFLGTESLTNEEFAILEAAKKKGFSK